MAETYDIGDLAAAEQPAQETFRQLDGLIAQAIAADKEVARLEAELRKAKETYRSVVEDAIPSLMDGIGLQEFRTTSGVSISIRQKITAAPLAANRDAAYDWLEANGHGGMVKRSVEVAFNREQQTEALKLMEELSGRFAGVRAERKVEPSTMSAFARRELEA